MGARRVRVQMLSCIIIVIDEFSNDHFGLAQSWGERLFGFYEVAVPI